MHLSPALAFFIQGIPESFVLVLTGLILYNVNFKYYDVCKLVLAHTATAFLVKKLPFTLEVHVFIIVIFLAIYTSFFLKIGMLRCFVISFTSILILNLVEMTMFWLWTDYWHMDSSAILSQPINRIYFGLQPPAVMLFLLSLYSFLKKLIKLRNLNKMSLSSQGMKGNIS